MNLKKTTLGLFALASLNQVSAQITSPAPYCEPTFNNQYRMFNTIKIKGTNFSFGPMGAFGSTDPFLYYNTTTFPDLPKGDTSSIELVVYPINDGEPIYYAVWIDYNQNNTFETSEIVMQNSNTNKTRLPRFGEATPPILLNITVPATAMTGKTRLRVMRSQSSPPAAYSGTFVLDPCVKATGNLYGCAYDFDVNIVVGGTPPPPPPLPPPTPLPKVDFASSDTMGTTHTTFTFTDKSTNTPTSWYWTFSPGATVSHVSGLANSQNVSVKFTSPGTYSVKLVAGNAGGKDSVLKTGYIVTLPTGISEQMIMDQVLFTPNPAIAGKIQIAETFKGAELRIMDINGKLVLQQERIENNVVDVSAFRAGMYFLFVRKDGQSYIQSLQIDQ